MGSASTMSTVGLELTNLINPDLTWKKVAKRYRSALKRTRKPVDKNLTVGTDLSVKGTGRVDDSTGSDNEKQGVAVLGCRFSDKAEHVPIKKRRFMVQSPSPPLQIPSLQFEVLERNLNGKRRCRAADASTPAKFCQRISEVDDNRFDYSDDFSGIEILATVACNNSMIDVIDDHDEENLPTEDPTQEGVGSSTSAVPFEENATSSKGLLYEDTTETSSLQGRRGSMATVWQKYPSIKDSRTMEGSVSSQDDRLHLDLNVMPSDILGVDSQADAVPSTSMTSSEMLQNLGSCEIEEKPKHVRHTPVDGVQSDVHANHQMSVDLKGVPVETCRLDGEEPKFEASSDLGQCHGECVPSTIVDRDTCCDNSPCPGNAKLHEDASPSGITIKLSTQVCSLDVQVENCKAASPHLPEIEKVVPCEIDCTSVNEGGEDSGRVSGLWKDGESIHDMNIVDTCQPPAPVPLGVEPGSQAQESGDCHLSPKRGDIPSSGVNAVEGQTVVAVDARGQANVASALNATKVDSPVNAGSEELMQKSSVDSTVTTRDADRIRGNVPTSSEVKVITEDPSDDSYESDVYQADKVHLVGIENTVELEAGYDSQFEDGELREPDARYCWDENEGEDGEVEQLDYGSECEDEMPCGLDNDKKLKLDRRSSPGSHNVTRTTEHCGTAEAARDDSVSPKTRMSDVTTDKGFPSGVFGSRASNRELLSHMEGCDAIHRKDGILRSRADYFHDLCSRDEREASSKNFMGRDRAASHMHGRSPGGRRFVNPSSGYWDSERSYSPTYRRSYTSGPPRPKGVTESRGYMMASDRTDSGATGFAGFDNHIRRQYINSSSNGVYGRIIRRRSPTNRDDAYGLHTGSLAVREISPIRGRFRRPPQELGRGIRDEYRRPFPEDRTEYSNRLAPRFTRRERSISPIARRRPHYNIVYKRSRSRSRSRSPPAYLPLRERNEGSRLHSRSPDLRSDARMDRVRLPFQKRFAAEYEEGFLSPTRSRLSPLRNSRWFDDRNGASDNFRGRKSPVRMFRRSQRFDSMPPIRRLNSDDQFRPMIQSRKFPDMGVAGRGGEYEESDDDRRKRSNRFEMVHRVRRYDTDGVVRRFRYNAEESCVVNDSHDCNDCNRVTDRRPRDTLRRVSEE